MPALRPLTEGSQHRSKPHGPWPACLHRVGNHCTAGALHTPGAHSCRPQALHVLTPSINHFPSAKQLCIAAVHGWWSRMGARGMPTTMLHKVLDTKEALRKRPVASLPARVRRHIYHGTAGGITAQTRSCWHIVLGCRLRLPQPHLMSFRPQRHAQPPSSRRMPVHDLIDPHTTKRKRQSTAVVLRPRGTSLAEYPGALVGIHRRA